MLKRLFRRHESVFKTSAIQPKYAALFFGRVEIAASEAPFAQWA
jgi:hypothetical protein